MPERRALAGECARRARAGEAPPAIRKALGLSYKAYSRWAKLYGFRQGDLFPDGKRAGARVSAAAGPGGWIGSGRYTLGLGAAEDHPVRGSGAAHPAWRGGEAATQERYGKRRESCANALADRVAIMSSEAVLDEVRGALDRGDYVAGDRMLSAWRARQRREAGLAALEALVEADRVAAGQLPEGWKPGDMVWRAQLKAMSEETLRAHVEALIAR
jgi:hypothetical protein